VFDLHGTDRLTEWKRFRDSIETSDTPFEDVALFWSRAPFVSPYLNYQNSNEWPDPWHLILDNRLDDLAITLGILYTIKLTQRFMDSLCEIHMSMLPEDDHKTFLVVDKKHVLNYEHRLVTGVNNIDSVQTNIIWSSKNLP
jgi:hypothetical protein